jgi:adenosylcobinamide kinase / adenosylcobinamide-phosphate guanylyltransferase
VFLATGRVTDPEMGDRIARHRAERPPSWSTVEVPVDLSTALDDAPVDACILIHCLTLWVSNLMDAGQDEATILSHAESLAQRAAASPRLVIVVSNEVGSGIVAMDPLVRRYTDILGRVNATFGRAAQQAFLVVAGQALALGATVTAS